MTDDRPTTATATAVRPSPLEDPTGTCVHPEHCVHPDCACYAFRVTHGVRLYPLADAYRRPPALDVPPTDADLTGTVLCWLEPEPLRDGRPPGRAASSSAPPRYAVRRAVIGLVAGRPAWLEDTLARAVTPLAGVELVDGLRALRPATVISTVPTPTD